MTKTFRLALAVLCATFAFPALATTSWAVAEPGRECELPAMSISTANCRSVVATMTTGTEAGPSGTDGMNLANVATVDVHICAPSLQTIATSGTWTVYLRDDISGLWSKTDLVLTVPTGSRCGYARGDSPGKGIPILAPRGRLAVVPSGAATSGGNFTVTLSAVAKSGNPL